MGGGVTIKFITPCVFRVGVSCWEQDNVSNRDPVSESLGLAFRPGAFWLVFEEPKGQVQLDTM